MSTTKPKNRLPWLALPLLAALVLGASTLGSGFRLDDYLHAGALRATLSGTSNAPWWDIFFLADFEPGKRLGGVMPWWTVEGLHIRFFRPVAALSHLADHALWPERDWLMHAHSVVLHALLVGLVTALYRRFFDRRTAAIAALIFAVSVNHASTVTWIANRNALLAGIFGVATLLLYQDWCAGKARGLLAAPCLVLALLSAEASLCIFGLLLCLPVLPVPKAAPSSPRSLAARRWLGLATLVVVTLAWRVLYTRYGFGAVASGAYIDPMRSPLLFVTRTPQRMGTLIAMGVAPVRLMLSEGLSLPARIATGALFVIVAAAFVRSAWSREHRAWVIGGLIALVPLVASTPQERLLTIAFIGFCPVLATVVLGFSRPQRFARWAAVATALAHLAVSPALFVSYALNFQQDPPLGLSLESTKARNLVLIHAPSVQRVTHLLESRFVNDLPRPAFTWYLWISKSPAVFRDGCCSLRIEDPKGHGREPFAEFFRDSRTPLRTGDEIETLAFEVEILDVDEDGYATAARFDFGVPLEHDSLVFVDWDGSDFVNIDLPVSGRVGTTRPELQVPPDAL